jgi:hypothetical protein
VALPGLDQTVVVPAGSVLLLASEGAVQNTSTVAASVAQVDVLLAIDTNLATGGDKLLLVPNTIGGALNPWVYWSTAQSVTLTPGAHRFRVFAAIRQAPGSFRAAVGGDGTSVLQAHLTVTLLNQ